MATAFIVNPVKCGERLKACKEGVWFSEAFSETFEPMLAKV
jgi:hypothetical protein